MSTRLVIGLGSFLWSVSLGACCMGALLSKLRFSMSSSSSDRQQVVIAASGQHTATLIFLHGLGDTGHGWASTLAEIRPPNVKIVCPTAPTTPVTLNSGFQMPAWFDLFSLDPRGPEDEAGIKKSSSKVEALIAEELRGGVAPENIILGGFSQGGALALYSGLTLGRAKVGAIVALSCWLPMHKSIKLASSGLPPVLQCHGDCDPVVPYKWGQLTSTLLKDLGVDHVFKTYSGLGHSSAEEELAEVRNFLERFTPKQSGSN